MDKHQELTIKAWFIQLYDVLKTTIKCLALNYVGLDERITRIIEYLEDAKADLLNNNVPTMKKTIQSIQMKKLINGTNKSTSILPINQNTLPIFPCHPYSSMLSHVSQGLRPIL